MSEAIKWPSREQWANARRTPFADLMPEASDRIGDYATPAEVEAVGQVMRTLRKELGRQLRRAPDEDKREELRWRRSCIARGLKLIDQGNLPIHLEDYAGAEDILAELHARHNSAHKTALGRAMRTISQTPIDDGAWEAELRRRAKLEHHPGEIPKIQRS